MIHFNFPNYIGWPIIGSNMLLLFAIAIIIWIAALLDCILSGLTNEEKLLWILVIIFFNLIGAIIYFVLVKMSNKNLTRTRRKLYKSKNKMLAGVCGGIANFLKIDPNIIRLAWVIVTIFKPLPGILAYLIASIIIPEKR